ncbi:MAG: M20 family metallopeptidase [Patescibacteria group bacterium]
MTPSEEILKITQDLIRFESSKNNPEEINKCFNYLENYLKDTGLKIEKIDINGYPNLIVTKGTKTPIIFLSGHLDVVEGSPEQFAPKIVDDRLYGRGALDMKSGVAVMTYIMKEFADTKHDFGLIFTSDEEIGGFNGTKALLDRGYSCQAAVIPDGGLAIHRVMHKAKGAIWIELKSTGIPAHASRPWLGENAINKLLLSIDRIQNLFLDVSKHDNDHWNATCNIGTIQGGDAPNRLAESASAICDIRYTENDDPESILKKIQDTLPDGVTANLKLEVDTTYTAPDNPFLIAYQDSIRSIGREPELSADHGSSDGRFFSARGIAVLMSEPDGGDPHSKNEWVSIAALHDYYQVLKNFLDKVA